MSTINVLTLFPQPFLSVSKGVSDLACKMSFGWSCKGLKTFSVEGRVRSEMTIRELSGFSLALPYVLSVIHGMIKSTGVQL